MFITPSYGLSFTALLSYFHFLPSQNSFFFHLSTKSSLCQILIWAESTQLRRRIPLAYSTTSYTHHKGLWPLHKTLQTLPVYCMTLFITNHIFSCKLNDILNKLNSARQFDLILYFTVLYDVYSKTCLFVCIWVPSYNIVAHGVPQDNKES